MADGHGHDHDHGVSADTEIRPLAVALGLIVAFMAAEAPLVVATAIAGAVVTLVALRQVARANRQNLNVEGSYQHLLTDLYAFGATAVAGVAIWTTGFDRADPIASLAVAGSMLYAAWP